MSNNNSTIFFSSKSKDYKYLSNDYILPMYVNQQEYYHVTGFVLSQKFLGFDDKLSDRIRKLSSPIMCRKVSLETMLTKEIEDQWNNKKVIIETRIGTMIKFLSNGDYARKLLSTGTKLLVNTEGNDEYWGCGASTKGKNMLGLIIMDIRTKIQDLIKGSLEICELTTTMPSSNTKQLSSSTPQKENKLSNDKEPLIPVSNIDTENSDSSDEQDDSIDEEINK